MSTITKFAQGKPCTARIPGVCNSNPETSIWSHLNSVRWGSGRGLKAVDVCGLITCSCCGDAIDGRRNKTHDGQLLDKEFVKLCAYEGHMESINLLWKAGIIKI